MDSKRFNIYAGSILGSVLLFLLLNFFSQLVYLGPPHPAEGEPLAFAVAADEGTGEAEEAVDLAALVAEADPGAGERVFNKCKACHAVEEGRHGVGPSLHGVVGRDIAAAEGFSYSDALASLDGEWDLDALSAYLENPQGYAPGNKMSFAGLPGPEDRVNVIVYLNEQGDSPVELVSEQTAQAGQAEAQEQPAEAQEGEATEGEATEGEAAEGEPAQEAESAEGEATEGAATEGEPGQEAESAEGEAAEGGAAAGEAAEGEAAEGEAAEGEPAQETESAEGEADGEYAELLAAASAEEGQKVYRKCQACHTLDEGVHRVGPSLHGVVGREAGAADGFNYSDAMKSFDGAWTLGNLDGYLENPKEFVPGNKMTFPGLRDAQDRIDVITYINEADGSPEPLQ